MAGEKKKNGRLGRGLDALIPPDLDNVKQESERSRDGEAETKEVERGKKPEIQIDDRVLNEAIKAAKSYSRITIWSPMCVAVFKYLKKTIPEFSMSRVAAELLEKAVKEKYPELWKIVESQFKRKS